MVIRLSLISANLQLIKRVFEESRAIKMFLFCVLSCDICCAAASLLPHIICSPTQTQTLLTWPCRSVFSSIRAQVSVWTASTGKKNTVLGFSAQWLIKARLKSDLLAACIYLTALTQRKTKYENFFVIQIFSNCFPGSTEPKSNFFDCPLASWNSE